MPRYHPNVSDPEAATDGGGAARASHGNGDWSIGAIAMRSVLTLGLLLILLIAQVASANAARVHHAKSRHVIVRPGQTVYPRAPPVVDPRFPPVLQDQTPSYNDPSKFGGA